MTGASPWQHDSATVTGLNKRRNQDCVGSGALTQRQAVWAAVADGHGSASHFRSDLGARVAVETFVETLRCFVSALPEKVLDSRTKTAAEHDLPRDLTRSWRRQVLLHHCNTPTGGTSNALSVDEQLGLYGSTFIGVLALPELMVCWQLGDGDVVVVAEDGTCTSPLDTGVVVLGEETDSLCGPEAWRTVRVHWLPLPEGTRPPAMVMLSTDGLSKSFVDRAGFLAFVRGVFERMAVGDPHLLIRHDLPQWLAEAARHSGDDTSVALVWPHTTSERAADPEGAAEDTDEHEDGR